ncbi:MAG TPA: hypothetical protein VMM58_06790 [Bacteroidota bacterium]|nr:hypothetical protein [Bacteroidota bacterium]
MTIKSFGAAAIILVNAFIFTAKVHATTLPEPSHADSVVSEIRELYESGSYLNAEIEARRFLDQPETSDSARMQAEKYIAFSLIAQDKPQSAEGHFLTILQHDSSFTLDPQLTSPKILSIFDEAKKKFFSEQEPLPASPSAEPSSRHITFRVAVFPGWEQLYQGRKATGYAFCTAGAAELLFTLYSDFQRRDARDSYLKATTSELAAERYTKYNRYYKAETYSAIAFGVTYLLSEVEVFTTTAGNKEISTRLSSTGKGFLLAFDLQF